MQRERKQLYILDQCSIVGWMAEWSKALVLGTSYFDSAGSNPAPVIFTSSGGLAQSVECVVRNDEAPGSKPGFSTFV